MGVVADTAHAQIKKVFLLLFVHKKKPFPCACAGAIYATNVNDR
jgi:hypothetical protein